MERKNNCDRSTNCLTQNYTLDTKSIWSSNNKLKWLHLVITESITSYPTTKQNTLDNYTGIDKIQSKQDLHYDSTAIMETKSGSWPWTLKRYIQVCEGLPWLDVKSSLTVSITPEAAESNTLNVWALLFSRSYVNSVRRYIFSWSITESALRSCSQPETLQSLGALDLSYATLCWTEKIISTEI